jgi:hypothetical protein
VTVLAPILLGIPAFVTLVLGVWKLYLFIKEQGVVVNVTPIVLTIEIISSVCKKLESETFINRKVRFLLFISPPVSGFYTWPFTNSIYSLTWPLSFVASLMLAFYWSEMLQRTEGKTGLKAKVMSNLKRMKIPFMIIAFVVLGIEFSTNLVRFAKIDFSSRNCLRTGRFVSQIGFLVINTAINLIVSLGVALYYIINGCRLLRFLYTSTVHSSSIIKLRRVKMRNSQVSNFHR